MPRPALHATDDILDAVRELVLAHGAPAATVSAIARESGAPVGSLYHRFGSREDLLARLWVRAVHRSQAAFLAAIEAERRPADAAVAAALAVFDFAAEHRADARLLLAFRREDLLGAAPTPDLAAELRELNRPIEAAMRELARRAFGRATRATVERTALAVIDLPYGAIRRPLLAGAPLTPTLRTHVDAAVRAVLTHDRPEPR